MNNELERMWKEVVVAYYKELSQCLFGGTKEIQEHLRIAVALGDLVVSVLATGPKVRGFKPGRGRWILRVIKSVACLPSEGK
jgi:hypothetical protein